MMMAVCGVTNPFSAPIRASTLPSRAAQNVGLFHLLLICIRFSATERPFHNSFILSHKFILNPPLCVHDRRQPTPHREVRGLLVVFPRGEDHPEIFSLRLEYLVADPH